MKENGPGCGHLESIHSILHPRHHACEECIKTGDRWVHLRICQACGATLCCDNSPNRHARRHAEATGHPVIASAEPGERWLYCYQDHTYADY